MASKYITDKDFDANYPKEIKRLAGVHWTPVAIARRAAKFLANGVGTRVLDIGSGTGKFCITGAANSTGIFTGVEQRKNLYELSEKIALKYNVPNTRFILANIMQIDLSDYDAFFFYNTFYENIEPATAVDNSVNLDESLYLLYNQYLFEQLAKMPRGTRLVTYWGNFKPPSDYELVYCNGNDSLRFWEKMKN